MFLRIVRARSAEQFDIIDIIEVKIPFDLNIVFILYRKERLHTGCAVEKWEIILKKIMMW